MEYWFARRKLLLFPFESNSATLNLATIDDFIKILTFGVQFADKHLKVFIVIRNKWKGDKLY